jgi:hypothetical protein
MTTQDAEAVTGIVQLYFRFPPAIRAAENSGGSALLGNSVLMFGIRSGAYLKSSLALSICSAKLGSANLFVSQIAHNRRALSGVTDTEEQRCSRF